MTSTAAGDEETHYRRICSNIQRSERYLKATVENRAEWTVGIVCFLVETVFVRTSVVSGQELNLAQCCLIRANRDQPMHSHTNVALVSVKEARTWRLKLDIAAIQNQLQLGWDSKSSTTTTATITSSSSSPPSKMDIDKSANMMEIDSKMDNGEGEDPNRTLQKLFAQLPPELIAKRQEMALEEAQQQQRRALEIKEKEEEETKRQSQYPLSGFAPIRSLVTKRTKARYYWTGAGERVLMTCNRTRLRMPYGAHSFR
jgi:hypothetical protein